MPTPSTDHFPTPSDSVPPSRLGRALVAVVVVVVAALAAVELIWRPLGLLAAPDADRSTAVLTIDPNFDRTGTIAITASVGGDTAQASELFKLDPQELTASFELSAVRELAAVGLSVDPVPSALVPGVRGLMREVSNGGEEARAFLRERVIALVLDVRLVVLEARNDEGLTLVELTAELLDRADGEQLAFSRESFGLDGTGGGWNRRIELAEVTNAFLARFAAALVDAPEPEAGNG